MLKHPGTSRRYKQLSSFGFVFYMQKRSECGGCALKTLQKQKPLHPNPGLPAWLADEK